jgi:hypothetical protein
MQELLEMPVEQQETMVLPDGSTQSPGFRMPQMQDGVAQSGSIYYCPAPPLEATRLRDIVRSAGAHVYLESDDTLLVGGGYVALHAASDGLKTLRWPHPVSWKDERTGEMLAVRSEALHVPLQRGQTLLLSVQEAEI